MCLVFKGRGRILAPLLITSINNLLPWEKNLSNQGNMILHVTVLWISKHFERLLSWVEWMRDRRTLLWLQKKRQSPQRIPIIQMRAVFAALIVKFQWVSSGERRVHFDRKFIKDPSKGWSWQNSLARSFENTSWCWSQQDEKSLVFARSAH